MRLKCIGGPSNGKIVEVADYYREHDQVPVYATVEFKLVEFEEELRAFIEGKPPESMTNPVHHYKISIVNFSQYEYVKFLIPLRWNAEDAIRYALGA